MQYEATLLLLLFKYTPYHRFHIKLVKLVNVGFLLNLLIEAEIISPLIWIFYAHARDYYDE